MFYRVDYANALLLGGFLLGLLFSRRTESTTLNRIAKTYYLAVAILMCMRTIASVFSVLAVHQPFWRTAGGLVGDLSAVLFGALFGVAARRRNGRDLLLDPAILAALCMVASFSFAMAGIGKAFSMAPMTEFFTQSGYSVTFLKFITAAEILGALGLLLPWAIAPALIGLTIDMFGAVLTHVHNGDPLNDSTGAIALLIRLGAIAILWTMRPRKRQPPVSMRGALLRVGAGAVICLAIAAGGSIAMRHHVSSMAQIGPNRNACVLSFQPKC